MYTTVECATGREGVPQAHEIVRDGPDPTTMSPTSSSQKIGSTSVGPTVSTKPKVCERAKNRQKSKLPKPVPSIFDKTRERPPVDISDAQPQKKRNVITEHDGYSENSSAVAAPQPRRSP